jgi:hypothetical protein
MNALENSPDALWQQMAPVLDEVIDGLDASDRRAILLRFFERRDFRSVGAALGISDDAAQKRVSRALEKLRESLATRGVTLPLALLASLMAGKAVSGAPAGLDVEVGKAALAGTVTGAGLAWLLSHITGSVAFKLGAGAVAVALVAWLLLPDALTEPGPARQETAGAVLVREEGKERGQPAEPITAAVLQPALLDGGSAAGDRLLLTIVAADANQVVPDASVEYWLWSQDQPVRRDTLRATGLGVCEVPVERNAAKRLVLVSNMDGFADTRLDWRPERGETIPEDYTLRLRRAPQIGGRVIDAEGVPVADAQVGFGNDVDAGLETHPQSDNFAWPFWVTTRTDAEGRWQISRISRQALHTVDASASHPDHVQSESLRASRNPEAQQQLLAGTFTFVLGRGISVHGIVVNQHGEPVPNAKVLAGRIGESGGRETTTAADGSFMLAGCRPGKNLLSAEAEGFAATTVELEFGASADPVQLVLQEGKVLRLRVESTDGLPIPNARVWLDTINTDHDEVRTQAQLNRRTGPDGRLEWVNAPDQELDFDFSAEGHMRASDVKLRPDGTEHVIALSPALTISGTVRDESTGQPNPRFRIVTGWPSRSVANATNAQWSSLERFWLNFEGGSFHHVYEEPVRGGDTEPKFVFKFEAEDYAPHVTRTVHAREREIRLDVTLRAAPAVDVVVLLPDGNPAAGADVGLVSQGSGLRLAPGGFSRNNHPSGGSLLRTRENGQFRLAHDESVTRVIVAHPKGYAETTPAVLAAETTLQILPWGRVEGVCAPDGTPIPDAEVRFEYGDGNFETVSADFHQYHSKTDSEGRFSFDQVPSGKHRIVSHARIDSTGATVRASRAEFEINPGETATVTLGAAVLE